MHKKYSENCLGISLYGQKEDTETVVKEADKWLASFVAWREEGDRISVKKNSTNWQKCTFVMSN